MGNIGKDSSKVTFGDPKDYSNRLSAKETNTPLDPRSTAARRHFTADPQGLQNQELKPKD